MKQLSRQQRRLNEREIGKGRPAPSAVKPDITLVNPVSNHFPKFVARCAVIREQLVMDELKARGIDMTPLYQMRRTRRPAHEMQKWIDAQNVDNFLARFDSNAGQHVVICGAGPSLRETAPEYARGADQLWGCNSALTWLADNGYNPTHGFAVDQTVEMCEEWNALPDVEYLLATTVHPELTDMLKDAGRRMRFFHNFVGMQGTPVKIGARRMTYENWLYATLFPPPTVLAGNGLNAVTRAIDVATFMGFSRITVLGADCALRFKTPKPEGKGPGDPEYMEWLAKEVEMHADGGNPLRSGATAVTMQGEIDGRLWLSKPDLMISAVYLEKMRRMSNGRIEVLGDTLVAALKDKDDAFLAAMPGLVDRAGNRI